MFSLKHQAFVGNFELYLKKKSYKTEQNYSYKNCKSEEQEISVILQLSTIIFVLKYRLFYNRCILFKRKKGKVLGATVQHF